MGRYLSLLGMVVFTLGVVALASITRSPSRQPASPPSSGPDLTPAGGICAGSLSARLYRAAFSLN
jgi:hypothetical protein